MPSSTRIAPKTLPCRCDDCREDHGRKRRVSKKHEDESSKQSARQVNGSNPFREEAMKTVARATEQLRAKPER